jgi:branched-chain amino acid transport system ATP-binding protein
MSEPLLEVQGVTRRFAGLVAVQDVDMTVLRGEIFGLLGPNGAGKTTLFNLIAGVMPPSGGRIIFKGQDVTRMKPDRRCRLGLARTFQITQPFLQMTVEENVMCGAFLRFGTRKQMRDATAPLIDAVGLGAKRHALAHELSTGQRKRLELARAMATQPSLLLLDEVTGGIDEASLPAIRSVIEELRSTGVSVIIIEHNVRFITSLADRVLFLNRGEKLAEGKVAEVIQDPKVRDLYLRRSDA